VVTDGGFPRLVFVKLVLFDGNGDVTLNIKVWEIHPRSGSRGRGGW
jgi:hypothetical protein